MMVSPREAARVGAGQRGPARVGGGGVTLRGAQERQVVHALRRQYVALAEGLLANAD